MKNTYSIGIDIGGTNTDMGLVRNDGRIMDRANIPTNEYYDITLYVNDIADAIKKMMYKNNVTAIDGIGIGAPNGNYYTGSIEGATNLNFKGNVNLREEMKKHFDVNVVVSNDANAAVFGEYIYGGAKGLKHVIMFTLGTGVGSGIIIDGRLVLGSTGGAGELGHSVIIPGGRQCNCGLKGCLETYTSARGICRTALELIEKHTDYNGILRTIPTDKLTSKMVGDAAKEGDPVALETFDNVGYLLGVAMANACSFSAPEAIFLMGGPVKAGEVLLKPLRKYFEENLLFTFKGKVEIKVSQLDDNDVAILGAAALAKA
ncbi:MAG TPA: ROK family protein [Bacteroidetes bacterium]|nr:ROK family protein [Candidatus Limimorpha avicola]